MKQNEIEKKKKKIIFFSISMKNIQTGFGYVNRKKIKEWRSFTQRFSVN